MALSSEVQPRLTGTMNEFQRDSAVLRQDNEAQLPALAGFYSSVLEQGPANKSRKLMPSNKTRLKC